MDMGDMSGTSTPTAPASAAQTHAAAGGMGGGHGGMGGGCKISMLWNWYTIDSCFIASTWHVRSAGTFAVSCIGVVLLVMLLEFLRRSTKEFDRFLIARHHKALEKRKSATGPLVARASSSTSNHDGSKAAGPVDRTSGSVSRLDAVGAHHAQRSFWDILFFRKARIVGADGDEPYLPTLQEQAIRALLHMCQFAVAYFVMLLAMYYNGYIIICIFIGSFIGGFIFQHEELRNSQRSKTSAANEATVCCA